MAPGASVSWAWVSGKSSSFRLWSERRARADKVGVKVALAVDHLARRAAPRSKIAEDRAVSAIHGIESGEAVASGGAEWEGVASVLATAALSLTRLSWA
eukprot:scaffold6507_cov240-Isochrysis_galbana.AAC.4